MLGQARADLPLEVAALVEHIRGGCPAGRCSHPHRSRAHAYTHGHCTDGQAKGRESEGTQTPTLFHAFSPARARARVSKKSEEERRSEPQVQRRSTSSRRVTCQKLQHLLQPICALSSNRVAVKVEVGEQPALGLPLPK